MIRIISARNKSTTTGHAVCKVIFTGWSTFTGYGAWSPILAYAIKGFAALGQDPGSALDVKHAMVSLAGLDPCLTVGDQGSVQLLLCGPVPRPAVQEVVEQTGRGQSRSQVASSSCAVTVQTASAARIATPVTIGAGKASGKRATRSGAAPATPSMTLSARAPSAIATPRPTQDPGPTTRPEEGDALRAATTLAAVRAPLPADHPGCRALRD